MIASTKEASIVFPTGETNWGVEFGITTFCVGLVGITIALLLVFRASGFDAATPVATRSIVNKDMI